MPKLQNEGWLRCKDVTFRGTGLRPVNLQHRPEMCHSYHLLALTERRDKLLFVMAEVGHIRCGFDIKGRMRRDHKELALGKGLPRGTRQFRLQRAGHNLHALFRVGLEGVFARLDDARRGRTFRCVHGQTLNFSIKI